MKLVQQLLKFLVIRFGRSTATFITIQQFVSYTSDIENWECCERMFMQIRCNDGKSNYCYIVGQSVLHCLSEQKRWLKSWVAVEVGTNKNVMCGCGDNVPVFSHGTWAFYYLAQTVDVIIIKGYLMKYETGRLNIRGTYRTACFYIHRLPLWSFKIASWKGGIHPFVLYKNIRMKSRVNTSII